MDVSQSSLTHQSKTGFLLISLPAQLAKTSDPSLLMHSHVIIKPTHSAQNAGIILYSTQSTLSV